LLLMGYCCLVILVRILEGVHFGKQSILRSYPMRFLVDQGSYDEMISKKLHSRDCYVRNQEYLHHIYIDGVKYCVARAIYDCVRQAQEANDQEALLHLLFHKEELDGIVADARAKGIDIRTIKALGDPPPTDLESMPQLNNSFLPVQPLTPEETGINRTFLYEHTLRIIYNAGRLTGLDLADHMKLPYAVIDVLLRELRKQELIDIGGQRGYGDVNYEYVLTPRGSQAAAEALMKTMYAGPCPVPLDEWIKSVNTQTIKDVVVTRRNIREAFKGLARRSTRPHRSCCLASPATGRRPLPSGSPT
jgi:hypothetical protein